MRRNCRCYRHIFSSNNAPHLGWGLWSFPRRFVCSAGGVARSLVSPAPWFSHLFAISNYVTLFASIGGSAFGLYALASEYRISRLLSVFSPCLFLARIGFLIPNIYSISIYASSKATFLSWLRRWRRHLSSHWCFSIHYLNGFHPSDI